MQNKSKINIVHIMQFLDVGGLETFILEFCKKIDKEQFNVSVLCLNGFDEKYKNYLEERNVAVELVKKNSKCDAGFFVRASRVLKAKKVDIIHSHSGCFFYSAVIGKLANVKKIIFTAHGMPVETGFQAIIEERLACAATDKLIAVSAEIADDLKMRQKCCRDKVEIIINGIDTQKYRPADREESILKGRTEYGLPLNRKIIGSVGRLEKVKNYSMLLKAVAELIHSYNDDVQLVLVGCGSEESVLRKLAADLMGDNRVTFLGMQYDLPAIYPLFDLFALSSVTEGTSISLLEAQSCGIPAVVTAVGGNPNIIQDGINGFLCASGDHTAMAAKLHRLLKDDIERLEMKKTSREKILNKFDINSMMIKYQQLYHDCLLV